MIQRSTPYLIPFALFVIGLAAIAVTVRGSLDGFQSLRWPSVQGTVIAAEIDRVPAKPGARDGWTPRVRYEYAVDGASHRGARFSIAGTRGANRDQVESMIAAYTPGSAVAVFYNPARPADSCLRRGPHYPRFFAGIAIAGILFAVAAWWSRRIRDTLNR